MEEGQREKLAAILRNNIIFQCEMAPYTAFRTGGEADAICHPTNPDQLRRILLFLVSEHIPYIVLGKGSNVLISDKGFKGVVFILKGEFENITQDEHERLMVTAWSSVKNSSMLSFCSQNGLSGLEFLAGIPGTIGGAITMNAGAYGFTIGDLVHDVVTMTKHGQEIRRKKKDIKFEYRKTNIPDREIIIRARFKLGQGENDIIDQRISANLSKRRKSQPLELPSAGSIFKNPPNDFAGRLLEEAGLKGKRIGGAMISLKHANFIVNAGGASSEDIVALMNLARETVREKTGIELEPEIRIITDQQV